jgi:hypothetical protein
MGNAQPMKIIKVQASFNRTLQVRQYEPVNFFASAEAEITEQEKPEEIIKEIFEMLKVQVNDQIHEVFNKINKKDE